MMSFCFICLFRRSRCSQQANPAQCHPSHSNLTTELEDSFKFSLAALTALLAVLAVPGSKALQPVVLTLLMYTITLRLALNLNTCFLQDYPTVSRLLHVIPLLGISCMTCIELIFGMRSPALATICIFLGILPLVTMVVHHGKQCAEVSTTVLPVRMVRVPAPAVSDPADHMPA